jgi:5-methylcytosine-specific restriction protein A
MIVFSLAAHPNPIGCRSDKEPNGATAKGWCARSKKDDLASANLEELRQLAYHSAKSFLKPKRRMASYRTRSLRIHTYVLHRADGYCDWCNTQAPFRKPDGTAYLEPHHTKSLAVDNGPDHPATVIALCPACHRRAHHSEDAKKFNRSLIKRLSKIETRPA